MSGTSNSLPIPMKEETSNHPFRILGVDVTPNFWSVAISDASWTRAFPFGVVARVKSTRGTAASKSIEKEMDILERALDRAGVEMTGVMVGWREKPESSTEESVEEAMERFVDGLNRSRGNVVALAYMDERIVLHRTLNEALDFERLAQTMGNSCTSTSLLSP